MDSIVRDSLVTVEDLLGFANQLGVKRREMLNAIQSCLDETPGFRSNIRLNTRRVRVSRQYNIITVVDHTDTYINGVNVDDENDVLVMPAKCVFEKFDQGVVPRLRQ